MTTRPSQLTLQENKGPASKEEHLRQSSFLVTGLGATVLWMLLGRQIGLGMLLWYGFVIILAIGIIELASSVYRERFVIRYLLAVGPVCSFCRLVLLVLLVCASVVPAVTAFIVPPLTALYEASPRMASLALMILIATLGMTSAVADLAANPRLAGTPDDPENFTPVFKTGEKP